VRPGMTDQLSGIRRILEEIIAPELREGYPSQVLRGIVKNLAMLEGAWVRILPFLEWDNPATAALLEEAAPHVDAGLRQRITESLVRGVHSGSLEELEQRNTELRGLLADAVHQLARQEDAAAVRRHIRDHFLERTRRYPFRMAIAAPTSAKN
jgi:hypothetical protein